MNRYSTIENIDKALNCIDADCERDSWIKVIMAIKSELGDSGKDIAQSWSRSGNSYNERDFNSTWKSSSAYGGVTIATVFFLAKQNGFKFDSDSQISDIEFGKRMAEKLLRKCREKALNHQHREKAKRDIQRILGDCQPVSIDTLPALYFKNRGLLDLPYIPKVFSYHPGLPYWEIQNNQPNYYGDYPALISTITDKNQNLVSIHKIYLTANGEKAPVNSPKKIHTPVINNGLKGASIKLSWPDEVLYLTEGLETALSVWIDTLQPVWACISAYGLETVQIPDSVKTVYIMADKDQSGQGERSANILARRLIAEGKTVHILLPKQDIPPGHKSIDWLDVHNMVRVSA